MRFLISRCYMAKERSSTEGRIRESARGFYLHLKKALGPEAGGFVEGLSCRSKVFIFSGVIRDYLLGRNEVRDVDLVLAESVDVEDLVSNERVKRNSFGGYKITFDDVTLDLWFLKDTWAYNYEKVFDFYYSIGIPGTPFFNASAIVFDFNRQEFHFTQKFVRFVRDKELDVVYTPNPNYDLCVINALNYKHKYNVRMTQRLCQLLVSLHNERAHAYDAVQLKHFGSVKFTNSEIESFVSELECERRRKRRHRGAGSAKVMEFDFSAS